MASNRSRKKLLEVAAALSQGCFPGGKRSLECPVLHLDAGRSVVANVGESREEVAPVHIAEPRQLGSVVLQGSCEDSHLRQAVREDFRVLEVDVEDPVL